MNPAVIVPWILTLFTIIVGIIKFSAQQRQANKQPFLLKQLELCFQATEAAGGLASATDPVEWERCRLTFWRLYWGPLCIVEDQAVESAMEELGRLIPTEPLGTPALPARALAIPSYRLAHACRDLVLKSWNVDLPNVEAKRTESA